MTPEDILQGCLEDLETGDMPLSEYLTRFPEVAPLAEPLRAAQTLRQLPRPSLRPATGHAHEAQLRAALAAQPLAGAPRRRRAAPARVRPAAVRWAMALGLLLALVWGGTGAAAAAAESVPGELLYPVKRTAEVVRLVMTPPAAQSELHLAFAEERAQELADVTKRGTGTAEVIDRLTAEMLAESDKALAQVSAAPAGQQARLLAQVLTVVADQQTLLVWVNDQLAAAAEAELANDLATAQANAALAEDQLAQLPDPTSTVPTEVAPTVAPTLTPAPSETAVPLASATPTTTPTATRTAHASPTASATASATALPSATFVPASLPTQPNTSTPTATASPAPSNTPLPTATPRPTDTPRPTNTPLPTATPLPTDTPRPTSTPTPTATPLPTETLEPTATPSITPEPTASPCPTNRGGHPKCKP
jgi:hypothetical protein